MVVRSLVCIFALGASALVSAQDPGQARLLAANCANCHGTDGRTQGGMPRLAGLPKGYIVQQMQDYKSGKRAGTIMHQLAKGYSDAEIEAIATFFSANKN